MARRPTLKNERGFSLTELLVASAVLGLMMAGLLTVQRQGLLAYLTGAARVEVQQNARAALETMLNEIRAAQAITAVGDPGCGTGPVPTNGGGTTISLTDQAGIAVQYQLAGTDLQRNGAVLVGGIQFLRIWCYNDAGGLTVIPGAVRTVHIRVGTRTESATGAGGSRDQHAVVEARGRLRNL